MNLPKPTKFRRELRKDGGYNMVPAYTVEEVQALCDECETWQKRYEFSVSERTKLEKQVGDLTVLKARLVGNSSTDAQLLRVIASFVHCGGLARLSVEDVETEIRKLTTPHFDQTITLEQHREIVLNAMRKKS